MATWVAGAPVRRKANALPISPERGQGSRAQGDADTYRMDELHERNQIGINAANPRNRQLFRGFVVLWILSPIKKPSLHFLSGGFAI